MVQSEKLKNNVVHLLHLPKFKLSYELMNGVDKYLQIAIKK